jgi:hypothetical protein
MREGSIARGLSATLLALLSMGVRAEAQAEALRAHGVCSIPEIGRSIAFLGDQDGDGVPDYVAGGPSNDFSSPPGTGHAMVFSGATGALLIDFVGAVRASFGAAVADAGDIDGDGVDDVAVGAPTPGTGNVYIYSGATHALLRKMPGASAASKFGTSLANLGDLDGDGVADLAVGAPDDKSGGTRLGLAVIYSGASGSVLAQWSGSSVGGGFGSVVADAGDVDRRGLHDLLVVEQYDSTSGSAQGMVRIYSGETFALLNTWSLGAATAGWTAANAGDVNGDQIPDVIFGNDQWPFHWISYPYVSATGGVWVLDGSTGGILDSYTNFKQTGWAVSAAGDVDGDGYADFAFSDWDLDVEIQVISGSSGLQLAKGKTSSPATALHGGVDMNGDGVDDLLVGVAGDSTGGSSAGEAVTFDAVQQSFLHPSYGASRLDFLGWSTALLDDVNGDGTRDLLFGSGTNWMGIGAARVLSGVDGSELRVHSGTARDQQYAYTVTALPDLDGDAIGEYAIAVPGPATQGVIEVRSGASGNLLQSLAPPGGGVGVYGASLTAAKQPSGAIELAVAQRGGGGLTGKVFVFDPASGSLLLTFVPSTYEPDFGFSAAFLGDLNGDGVGDWAGGNPNLSTGQVGKVIVFDGGNGTQLKALSSTTTSEFGFATSGAGDVDGDGVPDLYVGAPLEGQAGSVYLYSGATWSLLRSWTGTVSELGESVTAIGDLNRDGVEEVLFGDWGEALLISGATGGQLYRFDGAQKDDGFGSTIAGVAAPGTSGSMNGDSIPDVAIGAPYDPTNGPAAGRLSLYFLDDLYLQIDPPSAAAGATVTMTTSGGPTGALAMLALVAFDTTPLFVPLAFGNFDSAGLWPLFGKVPAGLSGHDCTLVSFTIGFNGRVVATQPMTLAFN